MLQKQLDLYYDIYRLLGRDVANRVVGITTNSVPPALASGSVTLPEAAEYTVPEMVVNTPSIIIPPTPATTTTIPAPNAAPMNVVALQEVHDRVLNASLQTIGARLESKLAEVINAVYDSAGSTIDAIGKIRFPAPQIVSR